MTRTIVLANQKGGVGKTTTAVALAIGLGDTRKRTLLIDLDPQANATFATYGSAEPSATVYEALIGEKTLKNVIFPLPHLNIDLMPSNIDLSGAEVDLISEVGGQTALKSALADVNEYDYVIIDAPPSLAMLTINALAAADSVIIPVSVSVFALRGIVKLENTINKVRTRLGSDLNVLGVVCTMADRTKVAADVETAIRDRFGKIAFETVIPKNIAIEEAHSRAESLYSYAPDSKGAIAYKALVQEVLKRD